MFATLSILERPVRRRFWPRRSAAGAAVACSRVTLPNFFSFYHLQVTPGRDETLPWDKIAAAAGSLRSRLLLPRGIAPDKQAPVGVFTPQRLPLLVLCQSALRTLRELQADPAAQRLLVVDPQGVLADAIAPFASLAAQIHVVTDALDAYTETADRLRESCGLSLRLTPDLPQETDCTAALADDEADVPAAFSGLVFTNHPCARGRAVTFTPDEPALPPAFAALCPPEIDPLQFASAAYELCAADELGGLWAACRSSER